MSFAKGSGMLPVGRFIMIATLALLVGSCAAWAQTAAMQGSVKDSSGAVIPETAVTVKNLESGFTRTAQTDSSGNYNLLSLPVGQYEVTVEKTGFKQQVRKGITLTVDQQAVINLTLEVGNVEQQVTITAEAPLVNTTLSPTSGLVSEAQIKDMPLNGRSFDQLLTLNVGTTNYTANTSHNAFSVAGRRPEANRFMINGVDYVGSDSSSQTVTPNSVSGQVLGVDAVREFNVVQPPYGAEYGKRGGGQVNIVASSGTNSIHGSVFEFLRNSKLDARNYFDFPIGTTIPPFKRNQFGGSLGGPIKKDKMFIFGNYEGFRQRLGLSIVETVPDIPVRQGKMPDASGNYVEVPNLKTGMLRFFPLWEVPTASSQRLFTPAGLPTGVVQIFANPVESIREDFGLSRFDYNMSDKDSLSFTFLMDNGERNTPNANSQFSTRSRSISNLISLQETRIFSPTVLNTLTLGFSRARTPNRNLALIPVDPSTEFIKGSGTGTITLGGVITGGGATSVTSAGTSTVPLTATRNHFTLADDLHYTKGGHALTFGFWSQYIQQALSGAPAAQGGSVSYANLTAMLQDNPTQMIAVQNPTALYYGQTEYAFYVEDEFKLRSNLSVRMGLRNESTTGWNERHGRCPNYRFNDGGVIITDPVVDSSCLQNNNATHLLQPRVGFAWDPTGTGTWAIRTGFGIYNDLQDNLAHRLNSNPPFNARISLTAPLLSFIPLPAAQPAPSCSATQGAPCSLFMVGGLEPHMHTPAIQQWSFTVERQLTKSLMLQLGYIGSQSYHLSNSIDANTWQPVVCQNPAGCPSGGIGAAGVAPQGTLYQPVRPARTPTNSQLPNPYLVNTFSWWYSNVSNYEAGTLSLVSRASHGMSFKTNYTFGKIMDLNSAISGSNGTNEPMTILNPYNLALNKGVAAYNIRHQFNTSFTMELPFGNGQQWGSGATGVMEKLIGGWRWNALFAAQSGFPFTPQVGSNRSGSGDTFNADVPNVNPNFNGKVVKGIDGFKKNGRYFDPQAFLLPAAGTYGNVSRGSVIGPGTINFDTSLFKTFKFSEQKSVQFRAEAFNLFNHANFNSPNAVIFSGAAYSTTAGLITKAATSRQIQFALKFIF